MSLTPYQASVPVFIRMLNNLAAILDKAAEHCATRQIDPAALIHARLYPDMFDFARQVACDHARNGAARLAGVEAPEVEKAEQSFRRIDRAHPQDHRPPGDPASRAVRRRLDTRGRHHARRATVTHKGQDDLLGRVLPNFYFHVTTTYDILRHNGVELGRRDYIGR